MREAIREICARHRPLELPLEGRRAAGVMLLLRDLAGEPHVLLQVRTSLVRHHKGEISLPGGRRDPADRSLLDTALRETHEEVGVPPAQLEVWGQLDDTVTSVSNYLVRPYVGWLREGFAPYNRAPGEVAELLDVPLRHLQSEAARVWKVVDREGVPTATAAYAYEGNVIWGATARMLGQFLALVAPLAAVDPAARPVP